MNNWRSGEFQTNSNSRLKYSSKFDLMTWLGEPLVVSIDLFCSQFVHFSTIEYNWHLQIYDVYTSIDSDFYAMASIACFLGINTVNGDYSIQILDILDQKTDIFCPVTRPLWAFVVTSTQNHWINILFNIIEIFK